MKYLFTEAGMNKQVITVISVNISEMMVVGGWRRRKVNLKKHWRMRKRTECWEQSYNVVLSRVL